MKNDTTNAPANAIWILLGLFCLCAILIITCGSRPKEGLQSVAIVEIMVDELGRTAMRATFRPEYYKNRCEVMAKIAHEYSHICQYQNSSPPAGPKTDAPIRFGE